MKTFHSKSILFLSHEEHVCKKVLWLLNGPLILLSISQAGVRNWNQMRKQLSAPKCTNFIRTRHKKDPVPLMKTTEPSSFEKSEEMPFYQQCLLQSEWHCIFSYTKVCYFALSTASLSFARWQFSKVIMQSEVVIHCICCIHIVLHPST